ncbi:MAG: tail fiber protein [Deltaproteobacteria bacterium]|nr:tail fiber protein [Deltaproteobacteria bacterium]
MSEPFYGEIRMFGFNYAPQNWAFCDGQIMSISQNPALFSLLGCNYGGDCTTTFALPDLRGRVAIHRGQGPGLTNRTIAQSGGDETISSTAALQGSQMPMQQPKLEPDNNMQPFLTVNFCIALYGIYPSRS